MATKTADTSERFTVDQLQMETATPLVIYKGAMVMAGWRPGKLVTRAEYDTALKNFMRGGVKNA